MSSTVTSQRVWLTLAVVCALTTGVLVGRVVHTSQPEPSSNADANRANGDRKEHAAASSTRFKIPVTDSQPAKGSADALVTVVEWSDVRCATCSAAEAALDAALRGYGDQVRVVWRNNAQESVPDALSAADLAMEAHTQAGKFWQALPLLRNHTGVLTEADLLGYAKTLGLDVNAAKQSLEQQSHRPHIVNDGLFAERFGARELPAFFINGVPFAGPRTAAGFKAAIEPELQRAQKLVATGTAAHDVYAVLTRDGLWNAPGWKNPVSAL
jgi:predicted DsbA family dithiol-disulfide isomerase